MIPNLLGNSMNSGQILLTLPLWNSTLVSNYGKVNPAKKKKKTVQEGQ